MSQTPIQSQSRDTDNYSNPVAATFNGIADLFRKKERIGTLGDDERLDGKTCLVTGANSGLGKATAIQLARRGAHLIMACRSGIPEAGEEVKKLSGSDQVEMLPLDLADLQAVEALCDELKQRGIVLDRIVLNAGIVPQKPLRTKQGFEMMFGVHFVGNMLMLKRLLADGTIPNSTFAKEPNGRSKEQPRIVFVSSETHRSGHPIDFDTLGEPVEYSAMGSIAQYGHSKLVMTAWLQELNRRLNPGNGKDGKVDVAVHCLCPGPINSNIARDAPALFKPLLKCIMGILFASPDKACEPVVYLTAARSLDGKSGVYLHLMTRKEPAAQALDPEVGRRLWEEGERLLVG